MCKPTQTLVGLTALVALSLPLAACSDDEENPSDNNADGGPSAVSAGDDAAAFCDDLFTDTVRKMTEALPNIGRGSFATEGDFVTVREGAAGLREAAENLPEDVAEAALATADALDVYVDDPAPRTNIDAVLVALGDLSTYTEKECDL